VNPALRNPWLRLAAAVAVALLVGWALLRLLEILTPFVVAFALAYFLNPAANALERLLERSPALRRRLDARLVAVGLLAVAVVAVVAASLVFLVPAIYRQAAETVTRLPEYARVVRERVEPLLDRLQLRYPEQSEAVRLRLQQAIESNLPSLLTPLTRTLKLAFSSALSFVLALLNLLVIPVFTAYLLYDMNRIREGLKQLVPYRLRDYLYSRFARIDGLLAAFVRGQLTVALLLGAFYAVALTACGVPMGLLVGFAIGLLNLIPFMSHVIGLPLALILSWLNDQDPVRLLVVAGVFVFGQFVEGNFVTPRVVGKGLGLHAVVMMLALLLGGTLFGFVGMLVAVPATAALSVFYADLREAYLRSEFYRRGGPRETGAEATLDTRQPSSLDSSRLEKPGGGVAS
jgi:predicted PurR-regulated permease PerM